jgi:hypothetical protein
MNRQLKWASVVGAGIATWYAMRSRRRRSDSIGTQISIHEDDVLLASEDSFPASDPPAYTPTRGSQVPR